MAKKQKTKDKSNSEDISVTSEENIDDEENISSILNSNNFDVLMHFAGFIQVEESVKFPEKYFENNTENAIKLFKICKKNGLDKIVFSSTAAAYGLVRENKLIDESTNLNPQNPYAESKIKTEKFLFENKNCGYGNGFSVLDVVNTANKICQNKINYKFSKRRDGDVEKLIAETSKISKHIQWQPKYSDLEEIINSSIKWEEKINARNS